MSLRSLEGPLRTRVLSSSLGRSSLAADLYVLANRARFARSWNKPVNFRGAELVIGKDLSLFPAVRAGYFEHRELDWLLPRVSDTARVWDVGANIGLYSVLLARAAFRGSVVAFEPVPTTAARLRSNLARNKATNVEVRDCALGAQSGRTIMLSFPTEPGCNRIQASEELKPGAVPLDVQISTADDQWRADGIGPDVVKVDIEGREPEFITGALGMLRACRPLLIMEINGPAISADPHRHRAWQTAVTELFDIYAAGVFFDTDSVRPVTAPEQLRLTDRVGTLALPAPGQ